MSEIKTDNRPLKVILSDIGTQISMMKGIAAYLNEAGMQGFSIVEADDVHLGVTRHLAGDMLSYIKEVEDLLNIAKGIGNS